VVPGWGPSPHRRWCARPSVEQALLCGEIVLQAQCHADRAEVLEAAGRTHNAEAALRHALDCHQRKGHKPGMRRMRERLEGLQRRSAERSASTDR
jgi:hypothetical protein